MRPKILWKEIKPATAIYKIKSVEHETSPKYIFMRYEDSPKYICVQNIFTFVVTWWLSKLILFLW